MYENVKKALAIEGQKLVGEFQRQLKIDGTYATGRTYDSIRAEVENLDLKILADKSLESIDQGRGKNQKAPPVSEIKKWIEVKRIKPRNVDGTYIKVRNKEVYNRYLAKKIAESIGERGTIKRFNYSGTSIVSFVIGRTKNEVFENLVDAYKIDLHNILKDITEKKDG